MKKGQASRSTGTSPNDCRDGKATVGGRCFDPPTELNLKHTPREQLGLLGNEESRHAYVEVVVSGVCELWNGLKTCDPVQRA